MNCPKCSKGEIKEEINLKGAIFNRQKIITFYCILCDWKNIKIFKLSENEFRGEMEKRGIVYE